MCNFKIIEYTFKYTILKKTLKYYQCSLFKWQTNYHRYILYHCVAERLSGCRPGCGSELNCSKNEHLKKFQFDSNRSFKSFRY